MTELMVTDDLFLNARVKLRQQTKGHRAGSDAVVLSATIPPDFNGLAIDAGSGTGAVGLMAAWRAPRSRVQLVEIDRADLALADFNIGSNAMQNRVEAKEADLFASFAERSAKGLCQGNADLVLTNPPYLAEGQTRASQNDDRARAHTMPEGGLEKWILACLNMLTSHGILTIIHRADQLCDVLHAMQGRFGDIAILPIYPRGGVAATRVLISGKRNSRSPLRILAPLVFHNPDGSFTTQAALIHCGDAALLMR